MFWAGDFEVWNWYFSVDRNYDHMQLSSVPFEKIVDVLFAPMQNLVCMSFEMKRPSQCFPSSSVKCLLNCLTGVLSHVISCCGSSVSMSCLAG